MTRVGYVPFDRQIGMAVNPADCEPRAGERTPRLAAAQHKVYQGIGIVFDTGAVLTRVNTTSAHADLLWAQDELIDSWE